ncbi:MAG: OB-fold domain-containing protein, partial [Burkholderiaceae bacterium]
MIGKLIGSVLQKNPPEVLVQCQGVGYEVQVSMSTFYTLGDLGAPVELWT